MLKVNNFEKRLQYYFDQHYSEYEDTAKFYHTRSDDQWRFRIPELKIKVTLTCDGFGNVTEKVDYE